MQKELIFSGIGGQGVMLISEILCGAACKDYVVTFTPFYGQEKRGGRTMAEMIIAEKMGSPVVSEADLMMVMDEKSLKDFEGRLKSGGILIYNSSMITLKPKRTDIKVMSIAANEIAQGLGAVKSANVVALGAAMKILEDFIDKDTVLNGLIEHFGDKAKLVEINKKAFLAGYEGLK